MNLYLVHKRVVFGVFSACMPEELTMKKDVAASAAGAEIYLAIPHIANALKEELKDIPTVANFATVHRPIDNL